MVCQIAIDKITVKNTTIKFTIKINSMEIIAEILVSTVIGLLAFAIFIWTLFMFIISMLWSWNLFAKAFNKLLKKENL